MRRVAIVGAGMTPFGEHFALGLKDLLPMAFAECAARVDKGVNKSEIDAAWFGAMGTPDGFPAGILADSLGLPDLPVTRIENRDLQPGPVAKKLRQLYWDWAHAGG